MRNVAGDEHLYYPPGARIPFSRHGSFYENIVLPNPRGCVLFLGLLIV